MKFASLPAATAARLMLAFGFGFFLSMFTLWAWPVAHGLGTVCGALVALLGFWLGDLFIMLIGGYVAYLNGQRVRVYWTRLRR